MMKSSSISFIRIASYQRHFFKQHDVSILMVLRNVKNGPFYFFWDQERCREYEITNLLCQTSCMLVTSVNASLSTHSTMTISLKMCFISARAHKLYVF